MNRLLGPCLLVVLLLAGCGSATSSDTATDDASPSSSAPPTSSSPPSKPGADFAPQTIAILSQTAAGGHVSKTAVRLDDETERQAFVGQFQKRGLDEQINKAIASATVPSGYVLMGAVISIGCDVPPGVTVTMSPDGYVFTPQEVDKPLQECFAPVTSVAIVAVPA